MPIINKIERLHKIKKIAISHGGICLNNIYINSRSYLIFLCKNNHTFTTTSQPILQGFWCAECSGNAILTIDKINKQYVNKNIICTSSIYIGNKEKLNWKCLKCNFIFIQSKNGMDKDFTECKKCKNIKQFEKLLQKVNGLGGKCLDSKYVKSFTKMNFLCKNGHEFKMKYCSVVNVGHWCPTCSINNNISEEICRAYFEQMFGQKFPSIRPNWLKKYNGYNLELDGYCEKLNLAFEHQGKQHYQQVFTNNKLENTIENDNLKLQICKNIGVNLIIIPQLFNKTPLNKLILFILEECSKLNINIPYLDITVNLEHCYKNSKNNKFQEYKNIAISKNGKCISTEYLGCDNEKLIWECQFGHNWKQFPYVIKKGHWCPVCSGLLSSPNILKN